jgi:hypothetical protein
MPVGHDHLRHGVLHHRRDLLQRHLLPGRSGVRQRRVLHQPAHLHRHIPVLHRLQVHRNHGAPWDL